MGNFVGKSFFRCVRGGGDRPACGAEGVGLAYHHPVGLTSQVLARDFKTGWPSRLVSDAKILHPFFLALQLDASSCKFVKVLFVSG